MVLVRTAPHRAGNGLLELVIAVIASPLRRSFWVLVHRWAGLTTALFLALAALTGSVLAWEEPLERWSAPQLLTAPVPPQGRMIDPVLLRAVAMARHPGMDVPFLPLTVHRGDSLRLRVVWRDRAHAAPWDELFIDPWTGRELGHRRWGDPREGLVNLMPTIYLLHYSLLAGPWGIFVMGLVALVWTCDSVVGFGLTLPVSAAGGWLARWRPSWRVRWGTSPAKVTFDLHRAGGLWIWPLLGVFAISSLSFNLPTLYRPLVRALGGVDQGALYETLASGPRTSPRLDFAAARLRGEVLARQAMAPREGAQWLWSVPSSGLYVFGFTAPGDVADDGGGSRLAFDSDSGALRSLTLAASAPAADRLTEWIVTLHMARVFGWPWRVAVSLIGLGVTLLSVTGLVIWWRKRRGRRIHRAKARRLP